MHPGNRDKGINREAIVNIKKKTARIGTPLNPNSPEQ
jgi:hypothetical protein